jgi:hypothetical protein
VAVSPDRDPEPVRRYGCFTADPRELGRWLVEKGAAWPCSPTGVYWMLVFEILEQQGLEVYLVNVLSDVSGTSGMKIIGAILKGERDPWNLAALVAPEVKATPDNIAKSLEGNWREELYSY